MKGKTEDVCFSRVEFDVRWAWFSCAVMMHSADTPSRGQHRVDQSCHGTFDALDTFSMHHHVSPIVFLWLSVSVTPPSCVSQLYIPLRVAVTRNMHTPRRCRKQT